MFSSFYLLFIPFYFFSETWVLFCILCNWIIFTVKLLYIMDINCLLNKHFINIFPFQCLSFHTVYTILGCAEIIFMWSYLFIGGCFMWFSSVTNKIIAWTYKLKRFIMFSLSSFIVFDDMFKSLCLFKCVYSEKEVYFYFSAYYYSGFLLLFIGRIAINPFHVCDLSVWFYCNIIILLLLFTLFCSYFGFTCYDIFSTFFFLFGRLILLSLFGVFHRFCTNSRFFCEEYHWYCIFFWWLN